MTDRRSPILPAHIEDTVHAIAQVHLEHHRRATSVQRAVDHLTRFVDRPRFVGMMTTAFAVWIGLNLLLSHSGHEPLDPPPFSWLENFGTLLALYITVLILITQRRENELTQHREQLTLELSILAEQKTAKIIELLEELRRDHPQINDRVDAEADEMAKHTDPQAVLEAIKDPRRRGRALNAKRRRTPRHRTTCSCACSGSTGAIRSERRLMSLAAKDAHSDADPRHRDPTRGPTLRRISRLCFPSCRLIGPYAQAERPLASA